jgi:hypothetical protein
MENVKTIGLLWFERKIMNKSIDLPMLILEVQVQWTYYQYIYLSRC